jgi:phosphoribosylformimino-5-aminoimidazole carboxamide ribotide isomerase
MRIIPVLDLMNGQVVRGIAGRRSEYRPLVSPLCADSAPLSLARSLVRKFALAEAYVADLDAIAGAEPAWTIYEQLAACGLRLMIDAGVSSAEQAERLAGFRSRGCPPVAVIAGLESLPSFDALAAMLAALGPQRLIFSLDLKDGLPLTSNPAWQTQSAEQLGEGAIELGIQRMIVLDLTSVGMSAGPRTEPLCRCLRAKYPSLELIAGGGVRDVNDLERLALAGCDAALVASALHDGAITPADVERMTSEEP